MWQTLIIAEANLIEVLGKFHFLFRGQLYWSGIFLTVVQTKSPVVPLRNYSLTHSPPVESKAFAGLVRNFCRDIGGGIETLLWQSACLQSFAYRFSAATDKGLQQKEHRARHFAPILFAYVACTVFDVLLVGCQLVCSPLSRSLWHHCHVLCGCCVE